ncbi:MAG TPA: plastocyanin/azurin family copper-binding protein [Actinomycetota bacterium]|nr:plastocyanin/azurin family copper-binding protein [Actinomycetota bacterium]
MKLLRILGAVGTIVVLAAAGIACSSSDNGGTVNSPPPTQTSSASPASCAGTPSSEAPVMVSATDALKFEPASITVKPCQLIIWKVTGSVPHTVTAKSGATFDSGNLNQNDTFTQGFPTAGTIHYYCKIHGASMSGTITVAA